MTKTMMAVRKPAREKGFVIDEIPVPNLAPKTSW